MRTLVLLVAVALSFAFAGAALAGVETYSGPRYWYPGESAGGSWKSSWYRNAFAKESSGFDTTTTFIDNTTYAWHGTTRNRDLITVALWFSSQGKKAHCRSHRGYHWGSCYVND